MRRFRPNYGEPGLESRVVAIETGLTNMAGEVSALTGAVRAIGERLNESQRTPWATLSGWAVVILAIVSLAGQGYIREIDRMFVALGKLTDVVHAHLQAPAHGGRCSDEFFPPNR